MAGDSEGDADFEDELSAGEIARAPSDVADPPALVRSKIPADILAKYEVYSYRNAAVILNEGHAEELSDVLGALRAFSITTRIIRTPGGSESEVPKLLSRSLRPLGWHETAVRGDLVVRLNWKEEIGRTSKGKAKFEKRERSIERPNFVDGHKIDYVKGRVSPSTSNGTARTRRSTEISTPSVHSRSAA